MNPSDKSGDTELDLFDRLYPKTDDPPLPLPSFGKVGPTGIVELQGPGNQALSRPRPGPFNLVWEDAGLGIRIDFLEQSAPTGPEILAFATGRPEQQDQCVVIALQADKQLKFLQRSITLTLDGYQTCGGRVSFGPVADIAAKLGQRISADAFLLVSSPIVNSEREKRQCSKEAAIG